LRQSNNSEIGTIEWERVKDRADQIVEVISRGYVPNLNDVNLKKVAFSPIDYEKPINSIRGTLSCEDVLPYQSGWMQQLCNYKIPSIPNVVFMGVRKSPRSGVSMAPGRNTAQVLLKDLGFDFKNIVSV
jgi:beta-carotene ketolase (CrtO type)